MQSAAASSVLFLIRLPKMSFFVQLPFHFPEARWPQHVPELKSIEIILDSGKMREQLYSSRDLWVGGVGGPLCVGLLTPCRNAMTLSAKDLTSTYSGVYRKVFSSGFFGSWRGGLLPTFTAIPCFTCIGPGYLAAYEATGIAPVACFIAATVESSLSFSSQRRNAVIQYNSTKRGVWQQVPIPGVSKFVGPGFWSHVGRNGVAMTGIRCISPKVENMLRQAPLSKEQRHITADFVSSCIAATLSMPFNHIFSWSACTPQLERMTLLEKTKASGNFLFNEYRSQGMQLLTRDLAVRMGYTGFLYTFYRIFERRVL